MESLAVLGIGIAIVWLVFWMVKNERARSIRGQTGLFRMRDHRPEESRPVSRRGR